MITLFTGAPGSGKSNAAVSLMASDLSDGRVLYVAGIPELKIPGATIVELKDPNNWHNEVPDGACVIIDEVQNYWRPRGPGQKPPDAIQKLETHRHRGIDFYIITQGPNLVDSNVRALVGRHVHLRDLGFLGRWWYEWPECADNCRNSWKNAPIKKKYKLDKKAQSMYKSASIHIKPVRSFPMMFVVMILALVITGVMAWKVYTVISSKVNPVSSVPVATSGLPGSASAAQAKPMEPQDNYDVMAFVPRISNIPNSAPAYDQLRQVVSMPIVAGGIIMNGRARCYTQQGTYIEMTSDECKPYILNRQFNPYMQDVRDVPRETSKKDPESQGRPNTQKP